MARYRDYFCVPAQYRFSHLYDIGPAPLRFNVITPIFKISNSGWCTRYSLRRHKFEVSFRKHVGVVDGHNTGILEFPPDIPDPPNPKYQARNCSYSSKFV
ncbi:hypothetical protein DPMN_014423 [Dreissena polymorpha]|uniref:Uncharacterized protein n=1 Tax=Dreissena polymorpha TaxID=45954 RepID=A0A9D4NAW1_DREPO|nr:hypothetical protein DPMN_014423 [Dreissena polymorpha]